MCVKLQIQTSTSSVLDEATFSAASVVAVVFSLTL